MTLDDMDAWYKIKNIEEIDSPSIAVYEDRLLFNLQEMLAIVANKPTMIMPHIKTNKMPKVITKIVSMGIKNFKASTIAEAEMAAQNGAAIILIAHQLVGPKIERLCKLIQQYPNCNFYTIIDNIKSLENLNNVAFKTTVKIGFFIDINNGMNRSGIELGADLNMLIEKVSAFNSLFFCGFHVYDSHLRDSNFEKRKDQIEKGFKEVEVLFKRLKEKNNQLQLICGGTPSFTSHSIVQDRISSPGTCVLWDWGYSEKLTEQKFKYAALLISRVISKPKKGIITLDLGHKSVASENPIDRRIQFLNLTDYKILSQSEEHGVVQVKNWEAINIGDVFYGVPYHICPTINLYDTVSVIKNSKKTTEWEITARKRKITI